MASLTWWTQVWASSGSWWRTGKPGGAAVHGVTKSQKQLRDWTELNWTVSTSSIPFCLTFAHSLSFPGWPMDPDTSTTLDLGYSQNCMMPVCPKEQHLLTELHLWTLKPSHHHPASLLRSDKYFECFISETQYLPLRDAMRPFTSFPPKVNFCDECNILKPINLTVWRIQIRNYWQLMEPKCRDEAGFLICPSKCWDVYWLKYDALQGTQHKSKLY